MEILTASNRYVLMVLSNGFKPLEVVACTGLNERPCINTRFINKEFFICLFLAGECIYAHRWPAFIVGLLQK